MTKVVGACGLMCSACDAYLATQAGDSSAIAELAVEWSQRYGGDITPDSVWCDGCMTAGERKCGHARYGCTIRACALERGVLTCAECRDYQCHKLSAFLQTLPEARKTLEAIRRGEA